MSNAEHAVAGAAPSGWRRPAGEPSLSEVWGSIPVTGSGWRRLLAFLGPGYLVSVGYMDPGNWATALAGGSKFGYTLLCVALISNLMAILLQALCARLGFASGRDLAQACRDSFSRPVAYVLWGLAEVAICATDLAEVIGTAIGLNLLFGIPLEVGVIITALDVFLILYLQNLGFRWIEAFVVAMLGVIALCFGVQLAMAKPELHAIITGFAPTVDVLRNPDMLYLAMGILGATVMPHNLYLHSSIVQTRMVANTEPAKREAIKYATIDSTIAPSASRQFWIAAVIGSIGPRSSRESEATTSDELAGLRGRTTNAHRLSTTFDSGTVSPPASGTSGHSRSDLA